MLNRELLCAALARVEFEDSKEESESLWDQAVWCEASECGTKFCYAGWIVAEAAQRDPLRISLKGVTRDDHVLLYGQRVEIREAAIQLSGLPEHEAFLLFLPSNTLPCLKSRLREIFAREDEEKQDAREAEEHFDFAEKKGA